MEFEMPVSPGALAATIFGLVVGLLGLRFAWKFVTQFPREIHEGERRREAEQAAAEAATAEEAAAEEATAEQTEHSEAEDRTS